MEEIKSNKDVAIEYCRKKREELYSTYELLKENGSNVVANDILIARNWIGKLLNELGEPYPYTKDCDTPSTDIPTKAPTVVIGRELFITIREEYDNIANTILSFTKFFSEGSKGSLACHFVYKHLHDVRHSLGWALAKTSQKNESIEEEKPTEEISLDFDNE